MISQITMQICDRCDTVSFGSTEVLCIQCNNKTRSTLFTRYIKKEKPSYCLCKLSVLHENNICVNCGLPYKHLRDAPFTVFDVPRPWSTDDMKEYCSCGEDCIPMLGDNTCVRCDLEIKKVAK